MSLQVWLPLNGDLHNQGLSDLQFSIVSSNTTIDNNGKIGQCYNNNSFTAGGLVSDKEIDLPLTHSMFCWFKFTSLNQSSSLGGGLVTVHNHSNNTGTGITIKYVSSTTGYLSLNTGTGSSRTYNTYCGTTLLQANTWYHGGFTYDGKEIKIYVNGKLEKTQSFTGMSMVSSIVKIFIWSTVNNSYKFNGSLNDVRIYDHALSDKEVEEIARGLVLHYKLDDIDINNATNLVTSITSGGQTTVSNGVITTSGLDKDTYFTLNLSENIVNGTSYILSCNADIPEGYYWRFPLGTQSNSTIPFVIYNGYNIFSFTANDIDWGTKRLFFDDNVATVRSSGKITKLWDFKLIKTGGIIHDCSGYGNDGTVTSVALSNESARYSHNIILSGSTSYIKVTDNKWMAQHAQEMTINLWAKASSWPANSRLFSCTESGGFNTEGGGSGYWRFPIYVCTNEAQTSYAYKYDSQELQLSALPTNEWVMLTFVYDSTGTRTYINGQLHHTYTNTSYGIRFNTNARLFLGCEASGANAASPWFKGEESDFRLYYTALTEEQIQDLYHTSASIDNQGNIYARELVEI